MRVLYRIFKCVVYLKLSYISQQQILLRIHLYTTPENDFIKLQDNYVEYSNLWRTNAT